MSDLWGKSVELLPKFGLLGVGPLVGVARDANGGTDWRSRLNCRARPVRLLPPEPDRLGGPRSPPAGAAAFCADPDPRLLLHSPQDRGFVHRSWFVSGRELLADQALAMTSSWVLLLTDDPLTEATVSRLAGSAGLPVRSDDHRLDAVGPPGLVVLGADRSADWLLPAVAAGVPRILVATGEPEDRFWRAALELRAEQVVLLPQAEQVLLDRLTRLTDRSDCRPLVIGVIGGCGGAGASVLAGALARAAVPFARSLLIEIDRWGSGVDLLFGAEDEPGLRWPDLVSARGRLLPGSVLGAVPVVDGLHVLSWDRSPTLIDLPAAAAASVLTTAMQEFAIVVLDLPRWLDAGAVAVTRVVSFGLLIVPAEVRAAAAARRVAAGLREHLSDVRVVVRGPAASGLRPETIAAALDLPLAGRLRPEPGLREALDRGEPPGLRPRGPLSRLCRQLLASEVAERGLPRGRGR